MVGIVGHDRRLSEVTLSEQISVVDYLRKVAGKYKARILVTGTAVGRIPNFDSRYHARILGMIHVSATDSLEKIYDVYDGDDEGFAGDQGIYKTELRGRCEAFYGKNAFL